MTERDEASALLDPAEAAEPAAGDVLEEDSLHRIPAQYSRICCSGGSTMCAIRLSVAYRVSRMPIHVRAEPGDYAEACLLPGDPLRAKYIAETYLDDVEQKNSERGLLGYTGTFEGKRVSVQGTGMGCPGATIVFEELVQLGVKKLFRVGTCGGLQAHHKLGDMIVAISAVPADSTAMHLVANEPHCPTASWELIHGAVHAAKEIGQEMHVGPIVSSDLLQPGRGPVRALVEARRPRGRDGGGGALHRRRPARRPGRLPPDRQRHHRRGRVQAGDGRGDEGRRRPDDAWPSPPRPPPISDTVFLVNPASANGSTGRRWAEMAHRAATKGLEGDALFSERPGQLGELAGMPRTGARSSSSSSAATAR